jgi:hypothetical protein
MIINRAAILCAIAIILLFSFDTVQAQKLEGVVYGYITDTDVEPIINAAIFINDKFKTVSDSKGYYETKAPIGVEFELRVDALNTSLFHQLRLKKEGDHIRRNFTFSLEDILLDSFTVRRVKRHISQIEVDPKTHVQFPSMQFEDILVKSFIGVSKSNELSSSYNVRGGNFDENLIYVNDIEVYRPFLARSGQQEGLSFVNPDMTKKVSFSAGGFESKYGDKLSSVLDVQYNKPSKFSGTVGLSMLGASVHVEDQPDRNRRFSYVLGVRYRTLQYVLKTLDVAGDYKPQFTDIQALMSYKLSSKWTLNYFTTFAQNSYLVVPESRQTSFGTLQSAVRLFVGFEGSELTEYTTFLNALTLEYQPNYRNKIKWISSAFNSREKEYFTIEGGYRLEELENNLGSSNFAEARALLGIGYFINHARNDLKYNVTSHKILGSHNRGKHTLEWGGKIQTESITDRLREWNYNDSAGYNATKLPHAPNEIVLDDFLATRNTLNSYRVMGYVQDRILLSKRSSMRLNVGVRSHYWSLNGQNVVSPRMNFSFQPNKRHNDTIRANHFLVYSKSGISQNQRDSLILRHQFADSNVDGYLKQDWVFRFATGYYFQPPFYRELRNLNGVVNMDLRAQRSIHFVAGGDLLFKAWRRNFRFIGEVYFKKLDDLIPYTINNVRLRYDAVNSSYGYAGGFDARVNGEFIRGLESWFNLSYLTTRENITFEDENGMNQTGFIRRPTDQRINFSILFQDELPIDPSYKMHLNLIIGSGLPYYFNGPFRYEERFKLPAYRRVDIGFSKELLKKVKDDRRGMFSTFNSLWMSLEVFNMLQVNNTASYIWVEDLNNNLYGVPNYLTGRRLNLKLIGRF